MRKDTAGRILVEQAFPKGMRSLVRAAKKLDKPTIKKLLQHLAENYEPEVYRDTLKNLTDLGKEVAYNEGAFSPGLDDLTTTQRAMRIRRHLQQQVDKVLDDPKLTPEEKRRRIVELGVASQREMIDSVFEDSLQEGNPLAEQVLAGVRGGKEFIASLRGADLLYTDHRDEPIPILVLKSYSEGLDPAEHFAGSFGARRGLIDTKLRIRDAGDFAKKLAQLAHRLVVTGVDEPEPSPDAESIGLPVDTDDADNVGALLARPVAGYPRNTVITPKILADLRGKRIKKILVRSPLTGGNTYKGLWARDVGVRERGGLAPTGDFVGIAAAQAVSEAVSQASLSSKHSGGIVGVGPKMGGFKILRQLTNVPAVFQGGAAHAQTDGKVKRIRPSESGGWIVTVGDQDHFVAKGQNVTVKVGETVEAGDPLSDGVPNPSELVRHKGLGEGRRQYVALFRKALEDSGQSAHRRNLEIVTRGLIDHVRLTEPWEGYGSDEVVPYDRIIETWKPRPDAKRIGVQKAVGSYLERPVLHYTVGTRVTPRVVSELRDFGIQEVEVHDRPPPFEPQMVGAAFHLDYDPDWMTRMLGSHQKKNLLHGVWRGDVSTPHGTSFVHGLADPSKTDRAGVLKGIRQS